ncbi:MAG TPA: HEPN domain-containing protein [Longimicrobiales bacterium]|nr:HEPN domain-containing protein [Longimicrobiales bacterium]
MNDHAGQAGYEPDDPREWLRIARQDLTLAETEIPGVGLELRAFHAQQAAEKALKGVCIARGVVFPFTHDIAHLLDVLHGDGLDVRSLSAATRLTRFATAGRYPSRMRRPGVRSFATAVGLARRVVEWSEAHASGAPRRVREPHVPRYREPTGTREPDRALLAEAVARVIHVASPERIILFGSGARGTMGPHSDLDLLVVTEKADDEGELEGDIHEALAGLKTSFDIVTVTPTDLARYGRSSALVYRPALEEGRVVYSRASEPSPRRN